MTAKHTPGPWHIGRYGKYPRAIWGATNALPVAHVHADGASTAVNDANARLIAAAPDLLALLIELVDTEGPQPGTRAWADKAIAVISNAKGCAA